MDDYDPVAPLSVVMAQFAMVQNGGHRKDFEKFLDAVPAETLKNLKNLIMTDRRQDAIKLACSYVVRFFNYIPMDMCLSHGEFVYDLLRRAQLS